MLLFQNHLHERLETSFADPAGRSSLERHMQPARFKLHAEERTCSPVLTPSLMVHALADPAGGVVRERERCSFW